LVAQLLVPQLLVAQLLVPQLLVAQLLVPQLLLEDFIHCCFVGGIQSKRLRIIFV
jgi:hypothetical protein